MSKIMPKFSTRMLAQIAMLIALEVVLTRFCSINTPIVRVGFGFVPIAICGMMYGPVWAGVAAALGDVIGVHLFPTGPYFPGFTLSAVLTGVIFGLFLYRRKGTIPQLAGAVALNCLVLNLLLTTLWLSILWGSPYLTLLPTRIVQALIMVPIQFLILKVLQKPVSLLVKRQYA